MNTSPLESQIGGSHYKDLKIQPVEFIHANKLNFLEGCVVKRLCRHRRKNGKEDLEKAIHEIRLLIELEYPDHPDEGIIPKGDGKVNESLVGRNSCLDNFGIDPELEKPIPSKDFWCPSCKATYRRVWPNSYGNICNSCHSEMEEIDIRKAIQAGLDTLKQSDLDTVKRPSLPTQGEPITATEIFDQWMYRGINALGDVPGPMRTETWHDPIEPIWHNPENVTQEQLGEGYRFLVPWEVDGRYGDDGSGIAECWSKYKWLPYCEADYMEFTYRVPASTPIPPKPIDTK